MKIDCGLSCSILAAWCGNRHTAGLLIVQELDGGVCDAHAPAVGCRLGQDLACVALHSHIQVGGQERHARLQLPHVQVIHPHHALNLHSEIALSKKGLSAG